MFLKWFGASLLMFSVSYAQLPNVQLPAPGGSGPRGISEKSLLKDIWVKIDTAKIPTDKSVTITFNFDKKPANYYHYYLTKPTRLVFDFYDSKIESDLAALVIVSDPIVSSKIEQLQVDLNKDIKGIQPDIHDFVRVSFTTKNEFLYRVEDLPSQVVLYYNWTTDKKRQKEYLAQKRNKTALWALLGIAGVGGSAALIFLSGGEDPVLVDETLLDPNGRVQRPTP